jgi:selenocysteine-specific elongation factor
MFVIGTAGHVDHGKSSLILALTGIDPDRLPEEKARQMTIDLGFAWMTLENGREVGIVDVPGHERFIKNMIAGAGAINAVLFVIAADDGWMPQSQEHLNILSLLKIRHGIIVLTKIDLVDPDYLSLQEQEIRKQVGGSFLADAPLVKVSSTSGSGTAELKRQISDLLEKMEAPADVAKPRLFIDRVFSMPGRGTVVTGTLTSGSLKSNQEVEILPDRIKARIREIQTHKKLKPEAGPGRRVAINLGGMEKQNVRRGQLVALPGQNQPAEILFIHLSLLPGIDWVFKKQSLLEVMLGTAEVLGWGSLLEPEVIHPGQAGLIQIKLKEPLAPRLYDRVILRLSGPQLIIGGGEILDWAVSGSTPKKKSALLAHLHRRVGAALPDLILSELEHSPSKRRGELLQSSHFSNLEIQKELDALIENGKILARGDVLVPETIWNNLTPAIVENLRQFHKQYPFKVGLKTLELADRLALAPELVKSALEELIGQQKVSLKNGYLALVDHAQELTPAMKKKLAAFWELLNANPGSPPGRDEVIRKDAEFEPIVTYLIQTGELIELRDGLLFKTSDFRTIQEQIKKLMTQKGEISVSDVRDRLSTSRKYAVPILEKLDQLQITKRKGDLRIPYEN